jgi:hypothetical protein
VPAAAVIPAPIAYIKVVAVKKLVVEFLGRTAGRSRKGFAHVLVLTIFGRITLDVHAPDVEIPSFTVSKLECSKQAIAGEYISME